MAPEIGVDAAGDCLTAATWPAACPPPHCKHVISVMCGNSRLHWALHSGPREQFSPTLFWRTAPPTPDKEKPTPSLINYIPKEIQDFIYGTEFNKDSDDPTKTAVAHRVSQRIPALYVYIVSTNQTHAAQLANLFRGIPCMLYKLTAPDFFVDDQTTVAYQGMGVDRVANVAASLFLYSAAPSCLVLDGGTAMTFTAAMPNKDNNNRMQLGGGIGAGLRMKFRSLFDYTGDLPLVEFPQLLATIKECHGKQEPLPQFSLGGGDTSSEQGKTITKRAIMGSVLKETALLLCSVTEGWLSKQPVVTTTDSKALPIVVITGGDMEIFEKLLQPKHSYIVETDDGSNALLEAGLTIDDDGGSTTADPAASATKKRFRIQKQKHLPHHGIQSVLQSKMVPDSEKSNKEQVRCQLIGQRVAVPSPNTRKKQLVYGTIISVIRKERLDEDLFSVYYDENGAIDDLTITDIYNALLFYHQTGEKAKEIDDERKVRIANKMKDAKEAADTLETESAVVREIVRVLVESRKPKKRPPPPPAAVLPPPAKKSKPSAASELSGSAQAFIPAALQQPAVEIAEDSMSYVGKRVAKKFRQDGKMAVFYGTVTEYLPADEMEEDCELWTLLYTDDDSEDVDKEELLKCIAAYEKVKGNDPRGSL